MWQPGSPGADAGYPLPAGYAMANGTSMAAPQATGGAALLLSAARAKDVGVTPAGLRRALYSSARPIPDVSVTGQGYGMMDVNAAWRLLARPVETRTYTSQAPVCTEISDFLPTPDTGLGIHNRCTADQGGHRAGQRRTYTVKLTRTSGPAGSLRHELRWIGNDGTFSSAGSVRLPLNRTVDVTVTARPGEGAHGAILVVDDPTTPLIDFEVLNTVVVATDPGAPAYAASFSGVVDRNATRSFFVSVPKGAKALQVNLSGIATGAQTRFIAINPHGVPVDSTSSLVCYTNFSDPNTCKPQERDYQNPLPGIWEIEVEARRTTPGMNNPFNVTARVQGVAVTPEVITLPSVAANKPTPVSWTVQNQFGPVAVRGQGGPLGSALSTRPTIADKQTLQYTVDVPAGTERLDVAIGRTADLGADLDLAVRLNGAVVAQSADGDSDESVSIPKPAAGTYTVVITGYAVPAGTTQFDYRDVYFSPSLGSVSIPARTVNLASGASSTIAGTVTVTAAPPAGRSLFGEMTVVTDQGAVVGRGAVTIGAVS
jgi:hypothetical protein